MLRLKILRTWLTGSTNMKNTETFGTPWEAKYFSYIQQAYKPHDEIPTKEELRARNPQYLDKLKAEKKERAKGMVKYFVNGRRPRKSKKAPCAS